MFPNTMMPTRRSEGPIYFGDGGRDPFTTIHRDVDRLFDEFSHTMHWPTLLTNGYAAVLAPKMDVYETKQMLIVSAELPGVTEKDVEVTLDENVLTVRGEKKAQRHDEKDNYLVRERSRGSFTRSIQIPQKVDPNKVRAQFADGVITISLPLPKETQRHAKKIGVKSGREDWA